MTNPKIIAKTNQENAPTDERDEPDERKTVAISSGADRACRVLVNAWGKDADGLLKILRTMPDQFCAAP